MTEILGAVVRAPLVGVAEQLNTRLWGVEPWRIVAGTASVSLGNCSHVDLDLEPGILGRVMEGKFDSWNRFVLGSSLPLPRINSTKLIFLSNRFCGIDAWEAFCLPGSESSIRIRVRIRNTG
jgi:hypothetical protein